MSRFCDRAYFRVALIGMLAATLGLGLASCGRKGPLDPPPAASLTGNQATGNAPPATDAKGRPQAPPGPDKRIPLDNLLN